MGLDCEGQSNPKGEGDNTLKHLHPSLKNDPPASFFQFSGGELPEIRSPPLSDSPRGR